MRKTLLLISAVFAMLAAVSCNKEELNNVDVPQTSVESLEFIAYTDVATKTTLNGLDTEWESGDEIAINGVCYFTEDEGSKAKFFKDPDADENPFAPFYAVYPYYANMGKKEYVIDFLSSGSTTLTAGSIGDDVISIAYSASEPELEFKNVVSLIKFQVPSAGISEIHISANENLAGKITVDYIDGKPIVTEVSEGTKELVLTAEVETTGTFAVETDYYVPVLPGAKTNLTVTIDGTVVATAASLTLNRSFIHDLKKLPTHSGWALPGGHNGWSTTSNYLYSEGEYYVVKNVSGLDKGFKFHHSEFGWKGVGSEDPVANGQWHKLNGEANISLADNKAYDIYMTKDGSQFQAVEVGSPAPEAPIVVADYWGIIGSMAGSNWANDLKLTEEGDYLVVKNIALKTTDEFKFRKNGLWEEQKIAEGGNAKADTEYNMIDAGSSNMKISTAGTYDVYVTKDMKKVYFMTSGKTPNQAGQAQTQTVEIYANTNHTNLWAWLPDVGNLNLTGGNWPGYTATTVSITYKDVTYTKKWTLNVPTEYMENQLMVIFSGSGNQTADSGPFGLEETMYFTVDNESNVVSQSK